MNEPVQGVSQTSPVQGVSQTSPVQANTPKYSPKSPLKAMIVVVLLVVLAGGIYAAYTFLQPKPSTQKQTSGTAVPGTDQNGVETSQYVGSQTITLRDSQGGGNSGNATRSIVPGNNFLAVYANLPDPEEGKFYQTWVVREEISVKSGRLLSDTPGSYSSVSNYAFNATHPRYKDSDGLYNTVIVSQESSDDNVMETKILEGTFTK
jgi:hypothetical protein